MAIDLSYHLTGGATNADTLLSFKGLFSTQEILNQGLTEAFSGEPDWSAMIQPIGAFNVLEGLRPGTYYEPVIIEHENGVLRMQVYNQNEEPLDLGPAVDTGEVSGRYILPDDQNGGLIVDYVYPNAGVNDWWDYHIISQDNNLFQPTTLSNAENGYIDYRCLAIKNISGVSKTLNTFMASDSNDIATIQYSIGYDSVGVTDTATGTVAAPVTDTDVPTGVVFSVPTSLLPLEDPNNGGFQPVLAANEIVYVYIKREVLAGNPTYVQDVHFKLLTTVV